MNADELLLQPAATIAQERGNANATTVSGPAPASISQRANRLEVSSRSP